MGNEQINADGAAEGDQFGVGNERLRENGPVTDEHNHSGNEYGRNPRLCLDGDSIAYQVCNSADNECQCKVIH